MSSAPIGVLGGTFDPVHHGHLRLAIEARERLGLDRVYLVPAKLPVHRDLPTTAPGQRWEMVQAAAELDDALVADDRELVRGGASYMYDTLTSFRNEFPDAPIYLILGMDAFRVIDTWHRWEELLSLAHIGIAHRPDTRRPTRRAVVALMERHSTTRLERLGATKAGSIATVKIPGLDISATQVRAVLHEGRSANYLVPAAVASIIRNEGLYQYAK